MLCDFLGAWQLRNAAATIPHCIAQLEEAGNLDNFRRLIGESTAEWRGFWFADSDLYKTIEAVAWEIARTGKPVRAAICDSARLWSSRSIAVKFFFGSEGADFMAM